MAYQRQNLKDGDCLCAHNLQKMEDALCDMPCVEKAKAGQVLAVAEVDETGKPKSYTAVNMGGGGGGGIAEVTAESIEEALGYVPANPSDIPTKVSELENDEVFVVNIQNNDGNYTADKTYEEIIAAAEAGKRTVAYVNGDKNLEYEYFYDGLFSYILGQPFNSTISFMALECKFKPDGTIEAGGTLKNLPTKTSELENDSGFITADDIPEGGSSVAIIDVVELPTEDINEEAFYRVPKFSVYVGREDVSLNYTVFSVNGLPEIGEPLTMDMEHWVYYYNMQDESLYGYAPDVLANQYGLPGGWYPVSMLFQIIGATYGGIIYSESEILNDTVYYFLLTYDIYSFKNVWKKQDSVGWAGTGRASEIHNDIDNIASGEYSSAKGHRTTASEECSYAEGLDTVASGKYSHAEGYGADAIGESSHAEGYSTIARGEYSHAEGYHTTASGSASHTEGYGTTASGNYQHTQGIYNIEDTNDRYAHIVGNGDSAKRSNAHTLDWDGNAWFAGDVYLGGKNQDDAPLKVKDAISEAKTTATNASDKVDDLEGRMNSGEFKGDKGDKGDPYTLTDTDKNAIAQAVYAMVADGNGVAY